MSTNITQHPKFKQAQLCAYQLLSSVGVYFLIQCDNERVTKKILEQNQPSDSIFLKHQFFYDKPNNNVYYYDESKVKTNVTGIQLFNIFAQIYIRCQLISLCLNITNLLEEKIDIKVTSKNVKILGAIVLFCISNGLFIIVPFIWKLYTIHQTIQLLENNRMCFYIHQE